MSIATVGVGLQGFYKIEAIRPDGRRRLLSDWFPNLILNNGLNLLGVGAPHGSCMVGTGTSTPTVAQTQLDNQIATSSLSAPSGFQTGTFTTGGIANHYGWIRWIYRFNTGLAAGNLTEVGVGLTNTSLFSRALILDSGGNPTTITVLSDESLDVSYELRLFADLNDVSANINISGTDYATVLRPSNYPAAWSSPGYSSGGPSGFGSGAQSFGSGALGDANVSPGGGLLSTSTISTVGNYVNNSFQRDLRYTWSLNQGSADIHNIAFSHGFGQHKASFSPTIPKRNTNILTLDLRVQWARRT